MDQPDRLAEITARLDADLHTPIPVADTRWLVDQLTAARAANTETDDQLNELRYRINRSGSLMSTSYVTSAIGHTRACWDDPRRPALRGGDS